MHRPLSNRRHRSGLQIFSLQSCAALSTLQILLIWPITDTAQDQPTTSLARIEAISAERIVVRKLNMSLGTIYDVPLKGLLLPDVPAANAVVGNSLWEPANFRLFLLQKGIAYLDSNAAVDAQAKATQDVAASKHLGIWNDLGFRRTHGYPDPLIPVEPKNSLLNWLLQNWIEILTVLGVLLSALALVTWNRRWEIIIVGATGVGKTEFVRCLKTDRRWLQHSDPESTVNEEVTKAKLRGRLGRSVYHLIWCDIGGQYPQWAFERLAKHRRLLLLRRRMVLVLVLSPYKTPEKPVVDEIHIAEQFGCVEFLVKGFIESRYGKRCKGVMLFVNMLDRFTDSPSSTTAAREFQNLFLRHAAALDHPNLVCLAGSAKQAWNTTEAWKWILQAVSGEVQA